MTYVIEYLSGNGYWSPLAESTQRTGFTMQQPAFTSIEEANEQRAELLATGSWRGLRVVRNPD